MESMDVTFCSNPIDCDICKQCARNIETHKDIGYPRYEENFGVDLIDGKDCQFFRGGNDGGQTMSFLRM